MDTAVLVFLVVATTLLALLIAMCCLKTWFCGIYDKLYQMNPLSGPYSNMDRAASDEEDETGSVHVEVVSHPWDNVE